MDHAASERVFRRFLYVALNPYLLTLWVTILIFIVFPLEIQKYSAKVIDSGTFLADEEIRFDDIDQDGSSERILTCLNTLGTAGLTLSSPDGFIRQWTFKGNFDFVQHTGTIITGDRDGNGMKEIYVFTLLGDSILLHCIPDFRKPDSVWFNRFVTTCGTSDNKVDPFIIPATLDDLTGDGSAELIFGIGTGFSLYPRRIYAYDQVRDSFIVSPNSGYFINGILQEDITGDTKKEIMPYGYATGNISDSSVPYSDSKVWLMVLDRNLQFLFDPVSFEGLYTSLIPLVLKPDSGIFVLAALHRPPERLGDTSTIYYFNVSGQVTSRMIFHRNFICVDKNLVSEGRECVIISRDNSVELYDESLRSIRSSPVRINRPMHLLDIDLDGYKEIIIPDTDRKQISIYRNDIKDPVVVPINGDGRHGILYSVIKNTNGPPRLFMQFGTWFFSIQYGRNTKYYLRYLVYAAAYLSALLFAMIVRKIQHDQLLKKQETEKKITDLQLQLVRNQLDPHFIMNAVNSIIACITDEDKEKARQQLLHFSKMHRYLLLSTDSILRSLQEELDFTENYLALEKFRFKDRFDYCIDVEPGMDTCVQVPKMIIQIHVENAVKHGLPVNRKGNLKVQVSGKDILKFEITDNGPGRRSGGNGGSGTTGKGLAVMDQFITLYNKYYPGKIITNITDIFDADGNINGTHVTITFALFV